MLTKPQFVTTRGQIRRLIAGVLAVVALFAGIAHASLHQVEAGHAHFGSLADTECQLATVDACASGTHPSAATVEWMAAERPIPTIRHSEEASCFSGTARGPPHA